MKNGVFVKKLLTILVCSSSLLFSSEEAKKPIYPWSQPYQELLLEKTGNEMAKLSTFPKSNYYDSDYRELAKRFPNEKIRIFGFGSLINKESAGRTVKPETVNSITPAVAFGIKRFFNSEGSPRMFEIFGPNLHPLERTGLNVMPTTTHSDMVNGVAFEVDQEEFSRFIIREKEYNFVPVLVADWNDVINENPEVSINIAYACILPEESIKPQYYPIRAYLELVRKGVLAYGDLYTEFYDQTTYLGNGKLAKDWDQKTFESPSTPE